MSVAGLAQKCGVPRQRIYNEIKRGRIRAIKLEKTVVIPPEECALVLDLVEHVSTAHGTIVRFNWI